MIRNLTIYVLILISFNSSAQHLFGENHSDKKQNLSFKDSLNFLGDRLNAALEEEWIIECYDSSIVISYCKSCADFANDSIKRQADRFKGNDQPYLYQNQGVGFRRDPKFLELRHSYKVTHGLDSLAVNQFFCRTPFSVEQKEKTTFSVRFEFKERYNDNYYNKIQHFNDSIYDIWKIKDERADKYVMPKIDNRLFVIPFSKYYGGIAAQKRIPYFSNTMNYAVFMKPSDNLICNYYFDPKQEKVSFKRKLYRMLVNVSYELGLIDFTYIGRDFKVVNQEEVYPGGDNEK